MTLTDDVSVITLVLKHEDLPAGYEWIDADYAGGGVLIGLGGWGSGNLVCSSKVGFAFVPSHGDDLYPIAAFLDSFEFYEGGSARGITQVIFTHESEQVAQEQYREFVETYDAMISKCREVVSSGSEGENLHAIAAVDIQMLGEESAAFEDRTYVHGADTLQPGGVQVVFVRTHNLVQMLTYYSSTEIDWPYVQTLSATATSKIEEAIQVQLPALDEISTCEQLASVYIERAQILLDSIDPWMLEHAVIYLEGNVTQSLPVERFDAELRLLEDRSIAIGCDATTVVNEVETRFGELVANDLLAHAVLFELRQIVELQTGSIFRFELE